MPRDTERAPIELGDFATTPIAPGYLAEGIVYDAFEFEGVEFFMIVYRAHNEPTFVVRQRGQIASVRAA